MHGLETGCAQIRYSPYKICCVPLKFDVKPLILSSWKTHLLPPFPIMPRAYRASSAFDWLVAKITEPWSKESKASSLTGQTHCLAEVGLACETKKGLGQTI